MKVDIHVLFYAGDVLWGSEHFTQVQELIWNARSSYPNLAYALGLDFTTVSGIQQSNHHNTDACFNTVLQLVLQNGLSRNKLANALDAKTVRHGQLARKVRTTNFTCELLFCVHTVSIIMITPEAVLIRGSL